MIKNIIPVLSHPYLNLLWQTAIPNSGQNIQGEKFLKIIEG